MREAALAKFESLSHLNMAYRAWLEESYQHDGHSQIGGLTPMEAFQRDGKRVRFATPEECYDAFLHEETRLVDKTGCFSLSGITFEAGAALARKKVDLRFDPFDLSVVEVWHGGEKLLEAGPLVVGEFTGAKAGRGGAATEVGRSRLLDVYAKENEKRRKNAMGVLTFGGQGGEGGV